MTTSTKRAFQDLISGTSRGVGATTVRALARAVAAPYSLAVRTRNRLFDVGVLRTRRVPCATIAVGNLTLGGVGKTPFIGWLADFFLAAGRNPGFVSRGYNAERQRGLFAKIDSDAAGTTPVEIERGVARTRDSTSASFSRFAQFNDEARELALRFPQVPHFQAPNRVEAALALLTARPDANVLLLDDAFQHRKISRDLNVVLLDALDPFGGERVFPAGFLREPISGLSRADVVLLNRADLIPKNDRETLRRRVELLAPNAFWAEIAQIPRFVYSPNDVANANDKNSETSAANRPFSKRAREKNARFFQVDFENWRAESAKRRFVAFCGLGAPEGFRKTLVANGLNVAEFVEFPDHCVYGSPEFARLTQVLTATNADALLTTAKDFVKLSNLTIARKPIFALGIDVEFLTNESEFRSLLASRFLSGSFETAAPSERQSQQKRIYPPRP